MYSSCGAWIIRFRSAEFSASWVYAGNREGCKILKKLVQVCCLASDLQFGIGSYLAVISAVKCAG